MSPLFFSLISATQQLEQMGYKSYEVQINEDGTYTLFDGNAITGDFTTIETILINHIAAAYDSIYGDAYYPDFPPDGFYSNDEARQDAQLEDGIYK